MLIADRKERVGREILESQGIPAEWGAVGGIQGWGWGVGICLEVQL